MSVPLATLTPEGTVSQVIPITIRNNLPQTASRRVAEAVDRMSVPVSEMIEPLAERMASEYGDASPDAVAGWPVPDELDHEHADRFTAQSKRPRGCSGVPPLADVATLLPQGSRDEFQFGLSMIIRGLRTMHAAPR